MLCFSGTCFLFLFDPGLFLVFSSGPSFFYVCVYPGLFCFNPGPVYYFCAPGNCLIYFSYGPVSFKLCSGLVSYCLIWTLFISFVVIGASVLFWLLFESCFVYSLVRALCWSRSSFASLFGPDRVSFFCCSGRASKLFRNCVLSDRVSSGTCLFDSLRFPLPFRRQAGALRARRAPRRAGDLALSDSGERQPLRASRAPSWAGLGAGGGGRGNARAHARARPPRARARGLEPARTRAAGPEAS